MGWEGGGGSVLGGGRGMRAESRYFRVYTPTWGLIFFRGGGGGKMVLRNSSSPDLCAICGVYRRSGGEQTVKGQSGALEIRWNGTDRHWRGGG